MRKLKALPPRARGHIGTAMRRNVEEGERVATTLAPDATHETRGLIHGELRDDGLTGIILAIPNGAPQEDKDRQYSIEHGRKRGNRGTTPAFKYMWQTRLYLAKKFRGRIRRAVRKAIKDA
jgi:hypothetical protein